MAKRKSLDLGKLLTVDSIKKRAQKPEKCEECKGVLSIRRGHGYCENCLTTTALPVARILNKGPHCGKLIYLKESIVHALQDEHDLSDVMDALKEELKTRDYFIVEEIKKED